MNPEKLKEIAKTPESRFDWWIQKEFGVLPSDPRFTSLTKEQKSLMLWHFQMDKNPQAFIKDGKARDDDYEEEERQLEEEDTGEEGIAKPMPEGGYHDPEFEEEWDGDFEEFDMDDVSESAPNSVPDDFDTIGEVSPKIDINKYDEDKWEEV